MAYQEEPAEKENSERWLLSYADFITLLMAFFIILYAMSQMDLKKYAQLKGALGSAFSHHVISGIGKGDGRSLVGTGGGALIGQGGPKGMTVKPEVAPEFQILTKALEEEMRSVGLERKIRYEFDKRGMVIHLSDTLMFPSGTAQLTQEARALLARLAKVLEMQDNPIRVEGHTDNMPMSGGAYRSNWELSTARATEVIAFLLRTTHLPPERLSAAGYGEYHPIADNGTADGKAANRRVDVVIVKEELAKMGLQ